MAPRTTTSSELARGHVEQTLQYLARLAQNEVQGDENAA
jgi:hypothetical protein